MRYSFKCQVAAECINRRIPGCKVNLCFEIFSSDEKSLILLKNATLDLQVTPHNCKIQDFDGDFYSEFHLVVCGLDSVVARR